MLALSFLLLTGVMLVAEAFDQHIPKGYIYFAMAFSLFVEMLNQRIRRVPAEPVVAGVWHRDTRSCAVSASSSTGLQKLLGFACHGARPLRPLRPSASTSISTRYSSPMIPAPTIVLAGWTWPKRSPCARAMGSH